MISNTVMQSASSPRQFPSSSSSNGAANQSVFFSPVLPASPKLRHAGGLFASSRTAPLDDLERIKRLAEKLTKAQNAIPTVSPPPPPSTASTVDPTPILNVINSNFEKMFKLFEEKLKFTSDSSPSSFRWCKR